MFYYDDEGVFRGIENGVDFQDTDGLLRMKWWEIVLCLPMQTADDEVGGN